MWAVGRFLVVAGVCLLVAAAAVALWPLHANGVTGTALFPHYHGFSVGVNQNAQLPAIGQVAQLNLAGVTLPQDVVRNRRHLAELFAVIAAVLATAGLFLSRKRTAQP